MKFITLFFIFFINSVFCLSISRATPICTSYELLTSKDRLNISNARFHLQTIEAGAPDEQYHQRFNEVLKAHEVNFSKSSMRDILQGLIAETIMRRFIHQSIGLEHIAYKRFQIFADLILFHRAMDHKGFVDANLFAKSRSELETAIKDYYSSLTKPILASVTLAETSIKALMGNIRSYDVVNYPKAKMFIEHEVKQAQILGAIEIVWTQLLQRSQMNQTEVMADLAIAETSIMAATATVGFTAIVGYGPTMLYAARNLWALPLSIAAGCAYGAGSRFFSEGIHASYLQMSRALYLSVKEHTPFACELGQQLTPQSHSNIVAIPFANPAATPRDYLTSCAVVGASMVFPKVVKIGLSAILAGSFAISSYNLVKETVVILREIPKLHGLRARAAQNQNPKTRATLESEIGESKARISLYLLASGNTFLETIKSGIFLYGNRAQLKEALNHAKSFLAGQPEPTTNPDVSFLNLVVRGLAQVEN
jgi:hypothetical protein